MSTLSRVNWSAQQRLDLQNLLAAESYSAFDFRAIIMALAGDKPFVLRGLEVIGKTGLVITVKIADALTFNPLDGNGSFYKGLSSDADVIIDLPADQENLFVEARFRNVSEAPLNTAYWDALALTGEDAAGTEFSASVNSQVIIEMAVTVNTVGFSDDAIPILRASTDGSNVTKMVDCRPMMWRLGTGGTTPDSAHRFPWATERKDSVAAGTGVGDEANSPFMARDLSGIKNDKGIGSLKEWADAVMTRISEIAGSSLWFAADSSPNNPLYGYITGLDLNRIFLDSEGGHSHQPSSNASLKWVRNLSSDLVLRSNGTETVRWQVNYGPVVWELGGTFTNNTPGGERSYSAIRFESPAPADLGNLYLLLERDIPAPFASGNDVKWASNSSFVTYDADKAVSGVSGDFTGIAVGDWIRKASEGFSQYYRVLSISDGVSVRITEGDVADASVVAVELDRVIATGASVEPLMYYRSRYSQDDLFADAVTGQYNYRDSNYYWLGRRIGTNFIMRGFGNLQEGEETLVLDDAFLAGGQSGDSAGGLMLQHRNGAVYSHTSGYDLRSGSGTLLTIRRRKRDNTVEAPGSGDNSGALLTYTIDAPVGLMSAGDGLWVRLSDSAGGLLASGSVTNNTDDNENTDILTNRWEIRSPANTPLRNFDNRDVYLIARCIQLENGNPALLFLDGTVINQFGQAIDNYLEVMSDARLMADLYLNTKTPKSVLFIDQNVDSFSGKGRVDEDNANFNYDKAAQELNLFNNIFGVNYHNLETPADQFWFTNLGVHSLHLGGALSTIVIPGDLVVLGTESISQTQDVIIEGKHSTLGVGNGPFGGGHSGMRVADNTLEIQTVETFNGQSYVDVTFSADPGYVTGQDVGVISNVELDDITAGQLSRVYDLLVSASSDGEMERVSATKFRLYTGGVATGSNVHVMVPPTTSVRAFDLLSEVHLSASDTNPAGMTSWAFLVKSTTTAGDSIHTAVTPFESAPGLDDFSTVPTARDASMVRMRIPYVWEDAAGPSGKDTTFDFTDRLTWNYLTNTFRVHGTLQMKGDIIPEDDFLYKIGTTALRWHDVHVGGESFAAGAVIQNTGAANVSGIYFQNGWSVAQSFALAAPTSVSGFTVRLAGKNSASGTFTPKIYALDGPFGVPGTVLATGTPVSLSLTTTPVDVSFAFASPVALVAGSYAFGYSFSGAGSFGPHITSGDAFVGGAAFYNPGAGFNLDVAGTDHYFSLFTGTADSTSGLFVHRDTTNTNKVALRFSGLDAELVSDAASNLLMRVGTKEQFRLFTDGRAAFANAGAFSNVLLSVGNSAAGTSILAAASDHLGVDIAPALYGNTSNTVARIRPAPRGTGSTTTTLDMDSLVSGATASTLIGLKVGTNGASDFNYGIFGQLAAASGLWFLYNQGTSTSYLNGSLGLGNNSQSILANARLVVGTDSDTTPAGGMTFGSDVNLFRGAADYLHTSDVFRSLRAMVVGDGAIIAERALSISGLPTHQSGIPTVVGIASEFNAHATAIDWVGFTSIPKPSTATGTMVGYLADAPVTVSSHLFYTGFLVNDSVTAAATQYAFRSKMMDGTGKWGFYGEGTAKHYLNGPLGLGNNNEAELTSRLVIGTNADTNAAGGITFGNDIHLFRADADLLRIEENLVVGGIAFFDNETTYSQFAPAALPLTPVTGISVFARDNLMYQVVPSGTVRLLTNMDDLNVYDEVLWVRASGAVGNNEIDLALVSPFPATITLPLDSRAGMGIRNYIVGSAELEVYLNGQLLIPGVAYNEVGILGSNSNQIQIIQPMKVDDRLVFRVDANDGQYVVAAGGGGGGGSGSLQDAYDAGRVIAVTPGAPVQLSGSLSSTLLSLSGSMYVQGTISGGQGLTMLAQPSRPFADSSLGLWIDPTGDLMYHYGPGLDLNISEIGGGSSSFANALIVTGVNGSGTALIKGTPVVHTVLGTYVRVDVSTVACMAAVGVASDVIFAAASGDYVTHGRLEDVPYGFAFGSPVYIGKDGLLTDVLPSIGVAGFVSGDFVIRAGTIVKSSTVPTNKDLIVDFAVIGQL